MEVPRSISLGFRIAAACTWAGLMTVVGLWAIVRAPERWPTFGHLFPFGGVAFLLGGQFVFMVLVADRLFPRASRLMVTTLESLCFLGFIAGLAAMFLLARSGGPS